MGLGWCLVPGWWFIALRGFMGAVNRPEPALWITLAAIPINALLAYALIYGAFGLPELDLLGAGVATTIVNLGMCIAGFAVCLCATAVQKFQVLGRFWRIDWPLMGKLFVVGAPIAGAFLLEYGLFATAAILMGWIGTTALAAHQIALQTASILFMVPFGISMAATVRVGHAVGRRDAAGTRRAGFAAIGLAAVFMSAMVLVIVTFRHVIPLLFLGAEATEAGATVALGGDPARLRRDLLHRRWRADGRRRRAARAQRHAHADDLCRRQLLGDRFRHLLHAGLSGCGWRRSASGSALPSDWAFMRCFWCGASIC